MAARLRPFVRKIFFGLIPALALLAVFEFGSLHHYFREYRPETFGLQAAIGDLRYRINRRREKAEVDKRDLPHNVAIFEKLYGEEGRELLEEFKDSYEASFAPLAREVARIGSKLLIVYVPPKAEAADPATGRFLHLRLQRARC